MSMTNYYNVYLVSLSLVSLALVASSLSLSTSLVWLLLWSNVVNASRILSPVFRSNSRRSRSISSRSFDTSNCFCCNWTIWLNIVRKPGGGLVLNDIFRLTFASLLADAPEHRYLFDESNVGRICVAWAFAAVADRVWYVFWTTECGVLAVIIEGFGWILTRDRVVIGVDIIGLVVTETVLGVVRPFGFDNVLTNNTFMPTPLLAVVRVAPDPDALKIGDDLNPNVGWLDVAVVCKKKMKPSSIPNNIYQTIK